MLCFIDMYFLSLTRSRWSLELAEFAETNCLADFLRGKISQEYRPSSTKAKFALIVNYFSSREVFSHNA